MASRWPQRLPVCGSHQPLDFGLGQILAGAQVGVRRTLGGDCAIYGGWRDQLEVRLGHGFRPSRADDCSYKDLFYELSRRTALTQSWLTRLGATLPPAWTGGGCVMARKRGLEFCRTKKANP